MSMNKPKIIIVNNKDEVIGLKERGTLDPEDIYRVSALWIQNSKGEILLAQRSLNKKHHPGKWGPAVAGTIDEGETYESNIIKEAEEEIGVKNVKFTPSVHEFNDGEYKHFTQWFSCLLDRDVEDFTIQREEVEKLQWFSKEELLKELEDSPDRFLTSVRRCVDYFTSTSA